MPITGVKDEQEDNDIRINVFCPAGFHGDPHLMKLVDIVAERVTQFVETGTEAGSTVGYFARMYPHVQCVTLEIDPGTFKTAAQNLANHDNIEMWNQNSLEYLQEKSEGLNELTLFWLDSHSHGWGCDLGKEIAIILERWESGYILLDDFEVPDRPDFEYDWYESYGKLNWENVESDIPQELKLNKIKQIVYPDYKPKFGERGWAMIIFGDVEPMVGNFD